MLNPIFNFSCYAVLSVDHCDDPDGYGDPDSPELRGFWPDEETARRAAASMEEERIAEYRAWWEKSRLNIFRRPAEAIPITRYAVIPLSRIEADDLSDVEANLKTAARLQLQGFGQSSPASPSAEMEVADATR